MIASCKISHRWFPRYPIDDKLTLVHVIACFPQATCHYSSQCWTNYVCRHMASLSKPWVNGFDIQGGVSHCLTLVALTEFKAHSRLFGHTFRLFINTESVSPTPMSQITTTCDSVLHYFHMHQTPLRGVCFLVVWKIFNRMWWFNNINMVLKRWGSLTGFISTASLVLQHIL